MNKLYLNSKGLEDNPEIHRIITESDLRTINLYLQEHWGDWGETMPEHMIGKSLTQASLSILPKVNIRDTIKILIYCLNQDKYYEP